MHLNGDMRLEPRTPPFSSGLEPSLIFLERETFVLTFMSEIKTVDIQMYYRNKFEGHSLFNNYSIDKTQAY